MLVRTMLCLLPDSWKVRFFVTNPLDSARRLATKESIQIVSGAQWLGHTRVFRFLCVS